MDTPLSDLNWSLIQSFLEVAETGSLSKAAERLGTSQPTVGRQIKQMEQILDVTLFRRQARGFALEEAGQKLMAPATQMRESMRQIGLLAAGQSNRLEGPVRITASEFTATHVLPPIIAKLRRDEPRISIDLVPTDNPENLLYREADIAVRMYRSKQLDIITKHLGDIRLGVYASTSYLDRCGRPETMDDLKDKDLVGYDRSDRIISGMRNFGWPATREWFGTRCDSHPVYWELVRAGCGVGFAQAHIGDACPDVEQLFPEMPIPGLPIWLAAHEGMRNTPRMRRVWDALETGLKPFVS